MKDHSDDTHGAVSEWEDDGGAPGADHRSEQEQIDARHQQRRLVKQGMALWNQTEAEYLAGRIPAEPPSARTH